MMTNDRSTHRNKFFEVWQKHLNKAYLDPLEQKILSILLQHPEYHKIFQDKEQYQEQNFFPELGETNPFLHLGLHITIDEQVSINQPKGIRSLYQDCVKRFHDHHQAQHCLMNSLAIGLAELQSSNKPFDEKAYLKRIKKALKDGQW